MLFARHVNHFSNSCREGEEDDMSIEIIVLSFFIYSFIGWFYESTICSIIGQHHFINRGFLLGPYCPVYGTGAVLCYLCFHSIHNPFFLFFCSMVLCSIVEYLTGYGMEKIFHAKWWDYSNLPFQLHGRICLYGAVLFGLGCVLVCKVLQPALLHCASRIPVLVLQIVAVMLVGLFLWDVSMTLVAWTNFSQRLTHIHEKMYEMSNETMENVSNRLLEKLPFEILEEKNGLQFWIQDLNVKLKKRELRFVNAFPRMKLLSHEEIMEKANIRKHIRNIFYKH